MIANNVEPWKPLYAGCDTVASVDQAATHSRGEAKLAFHWELMLFRSLGAAYVYCCLVSLSLFYCSPLGSYWVSLSRSIEPVA